MHYVLRILHYVFIVSYSKFGVLHAISPHDQRHANMVLKLVELFFIIQI